VIHTTALSHIFIEKERLTSSSWFSNGVKKRWWEFLPTTFTTERLFLKRNLWDDSDLDPSVFGTALFSPVVSNGFSCAITFNDQAILCDVEFIHEVLLCALRPFL